MASIVEEDEFEEEFMSTSFFLCSTKNNNNNVLLLKYLCYYGFKFNEKYYQFSKDIGIPSSWIHFLFFILLVWRIMRIWKHSNRDYHHDYYYNNMNNNNWIKKD